MFPNRVHCFIAKKVDHLHSDAVGSGFREGVGRIAVESEAGIGVDLGFKRGFPDG